MKRFSDLRLKSDGSGFEATLHLGGNVGPVKMGANWNLFLVREAWDRGMNVEDLADGFGSGLGTCGGDWSGVRDSSPEALRAMVERALNFLFPAGA